MGPVLQFSVYNKISLVIGSISMFNETLLQSNVLYTSSYLIKKLI